MTQEPPDPLFAALRELSPPGTTMAHDDRVRARCRARLAAPARRGARTRKGRAAEAVLLTAVVLYGIATITTGLRLAGVI